MTIAFIGDNEPDRERAFKLYVNDFTKTYGEVAIDKFAGDEIDKNILNDAISTQPFLSSRRMVIVRDLSSNKAIVENIEAIINNMADSTNLVLVENHIDPRSKFLGFIKKIAELREFEHLEGSDLVNWVISETRQKNGSIDYKTAEFLIDRVGTNHQLLSNEVAKLIAYKSEITEKSVKLLTSYSPKSSVFAMLDAAFNGDDSEALKLYREQRMQGMEPQAILGMIAWQLNILCMVKTASSNDANVIAQRAKLSPFVIRKNLINANRVSEKQLVHTLSRAIDIDLKMKTTKVKADDALQALLLEIGN
jgi:DNA polymerase-3 subunit delta